MSNKRRFYPVFGGMFSFCLVLYGLQLVSFQQTIGLKWRMLRNLRINDHPENQRALLSGKGICPSDHDFPLVIVVCSAVQNVEARLAVRETWGSVARGDTQQTLPSRLVFLLGRSENNSLQDDIQTESDSYGDILQEDFLDTYNNLTLKSVMLLKWVETSCPRAKFVMKTDDDMYVNIGALLVLLAQKGEPKLLIGSLIYRSPPIRDKKSKWYVPKSLFKESIYPHYLSGTGYVMSRDLVLLLYKTALETPFFYLEDVFITGICARKLKLDPKDHPGFTFEKRAFSVCHFRKIITSHRMEPLELRTVWRDMNRTAQCDTH